jgi:hypothetical protein
METIEIGSMRFVVAPEEKQVQIKERSVLRSKSKAKRRKRISQAKQMFARAKLHELKNVRKVGDGGMIDQPIETNGWFVMPPDMYDGIIPRVAWDAAETLTKGIAIKGFLVADDKREIDQKLRRQAFVNKIKSIDWARVASSTAWVVGAIAVVAAVISILPVVLVVGAVATAFTYDPLLIAVTEENEWICVYEWWH